MTTKKDEPGSDRPRPGEAVGGKKPFATIDLKATEVRDGKSGQPAAETAKAGTDKAADPGSAAASSTGPASGNPSASDAGKASGAGLSSGTAASSTGKASGTAASGTATGSGKSPATGSAQTSGAGKATAAEGGTSVPSSSDKKPDGKDSKPAGAAAAKVRSGGGFLSHLTAGVVGGFLALLGSDMLGPQIPPIADKLGLPSVAYQTSETAAEIERRLAALEESEKARASAAGGDLAARLEAADSRIAALEELRKSVTTLQEAQSDLAQKAASLDEKLQALPDGAAPEGRLAKLEQQLDALIASAGDGETGLPQLAALTGRMSDLETAVNNQLAALRESVNKDIEERVAKIAETSEAARAAAQRMDRELASATAETARLGQRFEALKADSNRINETLQVVQEETGAIRSQLDAFTGDVTQKLSKLTTAEDVSAAIKPVEEKMADLQRDVADVVAAEQDRKANAQRIVLSLELANLKRAVDRGEGYADELAEVRKASTGLLDLAALEPYESAGVATLNDLQTSFRKASDDILDAAAVPADGSVIDQLLAGARSVVRIRKVSYDPDDQSVEAIVGRINAALSSGRLGDVLAELDKLPEPAQKRASDWRKTVEARHAVDQALQQIESQLKASLSGATASSDANAN